MNKKFYFGLAATAALFASCSSDDLTMSEARQDVLNGDGRAPIELLLSSPSSTTRGTGTVGGMAATNTSTDPNNKWGGQTFKVYMLDKGELTVAQDAEGHDIYNNTLFTAPNELGGVSEETPAMEVTATTDGGLVVDSKVSYFPQEGNFDFWAYRLDDAEATVPAKNTAETALTTTFTIDGTQDIMVAKAVPNVDPSTKNVSESRVFSAYSVRRDVKPMLKFKHLLARLQFKVKASKDLCDKADDMNSDNPTITPNANAVRVTAIRLKSQKTGELIVAYKGDEPTEYITWDGTTAVMSLKQRTQTYTPAVLEWGNEKVTGAGQTITFATKPSIVTTTATLVFNSKTPDLDAKGMPIGGKTIAEYITDGDTWDPYTYVVKTAAIPGNISVNAPLGDLPADGIHPIWDAAQEAASATADGAYATPVGEALLLAPAASYELTLETDQLVPSETKTYYCTVKKDFGAGHSSTHANPVVAYTIPAGCQTAADAAGVATALGGEAAADYVFFTEDDKAYKTYTWSGTAVTATSAALYTEPGTVTAATDDADVIAKADAETTAGTKTYKVGTTKYVTVNVTAGATAADATACTYYFKDNDDANAAATAYAGWDKTVDGTGYETWLAAIAKGSATQGGAITKTTASTTIHSTKTILLKGPKVAALSGDTNGSYKANKSYTITLTLAGMEAITGSDDNINIGGYEVDTEGGSDVDIDMDEQESI